MSLSVSESLVAHFLLKVKFAISVDLFILYRKVKPSDYYDVNQRFLSILGLDQAVTLGIIDSYHVIYEGLEISDIIIDIPEIYKDSAIIRSIENLFPS